jgi:hypothetical protein
MRVPIGNDEWYLCDWSDRPDHEYIEFRGAQRSALQWAHQFDSDFFARSTTHAPCFGSHHPPVSNEQTVREVAWRLTSGIWLGAGLIQSER